MKRSGEPAARSAARPAMAARLTGHPWPMEELWREAERVVTCHCQRGHTQQGVAFSLESGRRRVRYCVQPGRLE